MILSCVCLWTLIMITSALRLRDVWIYLISHLLMILVILIVRMESITCFAVLFTEFLYFKLFALWTQLILNRSCYTCCSILLSYLLQVFIVFLLCILMAALPMSRSSCRVALSSCHSFTFVLSQVIVRLLIWLFLILLLPNLKLCYKSLSLFRLDLFANMVYILLSFDMRCLNPYRMRNPKYPAESKVEFIDCACGKCYQCLVNRRRQWFFRMHLEMYEWDNCYFLTLTYADEYLPDTVLRSDLQKFFKRFRAKFGKCRYYAIGEYGTDENCTHRPHYHAIVFSDNSQIYSLPWPFGRSEIESCTPAALNYVLHYHVRPKEPIKGKKTFFACSHGIGLSFLFDKDDNVKIDVLNMLTNTSKRIVTNPFGEYFVLPRYYTKKIEDMGYTLHENTSLYDFSDYPLRQAIKTMYPDLEFYNDGTPKNMSDDKFLSLMSDLMSKSADKLAKYNYQTKLHN